MIEMMPSSWDSVFATIWRMVRAMPPDCQDVVWSCNVAALVKSVWNQAALDAGVKSSEIVRLSVISLLHPGNG